MTVKILILSYDQLNPFQTLAYMHVTGQISLLIATGS